MKYTMAIRNTAILAGIGIVLTLLIGYVFQNTQSTYTKNIPYVKMGDYLRNALSQSASLLEEEMIEPNNVDYQHDVVKLITDSRALLEGVVQGKETVVGKFESVEDEETAALIKEAIIGMENYAIAMDERWQTKGQSFTDTLGNALPNVAKEKFNESHQKLQLKLDLLIEHFDKKVAKSTSFLNILSWVTDALVLLTFAALCFFVYRLLKRNEKLMIEGQIKLNEETKRVESLSGFIEAISTGNYAIEVNSTDDLSNKLITMRDTLRNNAEEDKRRNWATSGLAQIGEILRESGNIRELYDNIITFVVKYTKSNQGGMFLLNDDNDEDPYLELVSCYAFERKKFITKRVELGQGLVGQCYLEGARIHIRQIPEDYVHITSGLGGANPTSLLVIPMRVNDKTYGVLELASFKKYEDHEIELVEKFAESIGAEVSSVKVNESTRILLEKTQQQAEEMRAQEEEMRQNMEELEATQEEMRRKEKHVQDLLDAEKQQSEEVKKSQAQLLDRERVLSLTTILSEADAAGTIIFANDKLAEVSQYSQQEMIGKGHNLFRHPDMPKELFKLLWDTLKSKKVFKGIVKNRAKDGTHYWVDAVIMPVYENGVFVKYISARYHIKDDVLGKEMYNKQAIALGLPTLP